MISAPATVQASSISRNNIQPRIAENGRRMKSNAIIINTSRGALIDEAALLDALTEKRIAGAGLDLIDGEWLDDVSAHPLIRYANKNDNLVITPHIGGNTYESIYDARIFMARKIADHLRNLDE